MTKKLDISDIEKLLNLPRKNFTFYWNNWSSMYEFTLYNMGIQNKRLIDFRTVSNVYMNILNRRTIIYCGPKAQLITREPALDCEVLLQRDTVVYQYSRAIKILNYKHFLYEKPKFYDVRHRYEYNHRRPSKFINRYSLIGSSQATYDNNVLPDSFEMVVTKQRAIPQELWGS